MTLLGVAGVRISLSEHNTTSPHLRTVFRSLISPPVADNGLVKESTEPKWSELLSLGAGRGDRKPTALLRHIRSLNADPATLLRALFLTQLPHEVRQILAASGKTDLDQLAADADRIMEVPSIAPSSIAGIKNPQRQLPRPTANNPLCFYHAKFGNSARKCHQKGCSMGILSYRYRLQYAQKSLSGRSQRQKHNDCA